MYPTKSKTYGSPVFNKFFGFSDSDLNRFFGTDIYASAPAVNISENEKGFRIDVAAPGFGKDNFTLKVEDKVLTIKGEHKTESEEKTENYTRREFQFGSFERKFTLPENVNEDAIVAKYENGVLSISINKTDVIKQVKEIQIA